MSRMSQAMARALRCLAFGLACASVFACSCKGRSGGDDSPRPTDTDDVDQPGARASDAGGAASTDARQPPRTVVLPPAPSIPGAPLGLPEAPRNAGDDQAGDRARLAARVVLGRLLFFDPRLSTGERMACASCHAPETGWSDARARARTAAGKLDLRHTPTLVNVVYAAELSWDGRFTDLETMLLSHWRGQMLIETPASAGESAAERALAAIAAQPVYRAHFRRAFNQSVRAEPLSAALAAFVRTIYSGASPWDRHEAGEPDAVGEDAIAGFEIFNRKAQCALCHPPPLYTDHGYHDIGIGAYGLDDQLLDPGRALASKQAEDRGRFKTPTLRHVAATAPYFHDGSGETLADTVAHGLRSAAAMAGPEVVIPQSLTDDEVHKLLAFMRALTPETATYERPLLPGKATGPSSEAK
jgi:cytochrome c peroxidase